MTRRPRGPARDRGNLALGTGARVRLDPRERQVDAIFNVVLAGMSERRFQALIVSALRARGFVVWIVPNMRMTTAGLPDLVCWHPNVPGLILFWEIKTPAGRVTASQRRALDHLRTVAGADARVVRPADWPRLRDALDDTSSDPRTALAAIREAEV